MGRDDKGNEMTPGLWLSNGIFAVILILLISHIIHRLRCKKGLDCPTCNDPSV